MKKFAKFFLVVTAAIFLFCIGVLIADKQTLRTQIVRMHVVANSDSCDDQAAKLAVRDAITQHLKEKLTGVMNIADARRLISDELITLEKIADAVLYEIGSDDTTTVTLIQEEFDRRQYDTFSLPAGIYESLRIEIGRGEGKNWWCVVFPAFCVPDTIEDFQTTAVSSGFDDGLVCTLSNDDIYVIRFFLLDCFGKVENFFNIS